MPTFRQLQHEQSYKIDDLITSYVAMALSHLKLSFQTRPEAAGNNKLTQ
jgi:hypothetical protein